MRNSASNAPAEIQAGLEPEDPMDSDSEYFASYGDPGVHRLMIADHARTDPPARKLTKLRS